MWNLFMISEYSFLIRYWPCRKSDILSRKYCWNYTHKERMHRMYGLCCLANSHQDTTEDIYSNVSTSLLWRNIQCRLWKCFGSCCKRQRKGSIYCWKGLYTGYWGKYLNTMLSHKLNKNQICMSCIVSWEIQSKFGTLLSKMCKYSSLKHR
jgi:hypothetical protein